MAERFTTGIEVAEQSGPEHAIPRAATAVTAFVGRTLRGPVNRPVHIASFADFQGAFGGLWQPSTLGYAVEQFFDNGGREAVVLRVVNGARPPTLTLPAGGHPLTLEALGCGTREYLRASVDYDGIGDNEQDGFNLVLQRVRAPGSEYIEDQEIFRRLSVDPRSNRFVASVLTESALARVIGTAPRNRPHLSLRHDGRGTVGYVHSNPDGDDGAPLTDYDVIGSAKEGTGLFALGAAETFNFLCIPPLARDTNVGASTLLVAARFCRERNAILIVDPPTAWTNAGEALRGMRDWHFRSENAVMYFPRMLGFDRLRGRFQQFAACGAIAGMLARADEICPLWSAMEAEEPIVRPGYRPACPVADADRARLLQIGINTLQSVRASAGPASSPRTLAGGSSGSPDWKYLSARRLGLFIINSIARGTHWVVFETSGPALWRRVVAQVEAFFQALDRNGTFAGCLPEEAYVVVCDERINSPVETGSGRLNILFGFAASRAGEFHAYLVSHSAAGTRVRPASLNRLETGGHRLEEEMEGE